MKSAESTPSPQPPRVLLEDSRRLLEDSQKRWVHRTPNVQARRGSLLEPNKQQQQQQPQEVTRTGIILQPDRTPRCHRLQPGIHPSHTLPKLHNRPTGQVKCQVKCRARCQGRCLVKCQDKFQDRCQVKCLLGCTLLIPTLLHTLILIHK